MHNLWSYFIYLQLFIIELKFNTTSIAELYSMAKYILEINVIGTAERLLYS